MGVKVHHLERKMPSEEGMWTGTPKESGADYEIVSSGLSEVP